MHSRLAPFLEVGFRVDLFDRPFDTVFCLENRIPRTDHKYYCVQMYRDPVLLGFKFRLAPREDHGGVRMEIGLFGFALTMQIYDNRHWNFDEGRWEIYLEEDDEE